MKNRSRILVLNGISGVGKSTMLEHLADTYTDVIAWSTGDIQKCVVGATMLGLAPPTKLLDSDALLWAVHNRRELLAGYESLKKTEYGGKLIIFAQEILRSVVADFPPRSLAIVSDLFPDSIIVTEVISGAELEQLWRVAHDEMRQPISSPYLLNCENPKVSVGARNCENRESISDGGHIVNYRLEDSLETADGILSHFKEIWDYPKN
jgi:adenylate kinase